MALSFLAGIAILSAFRGEVPPAASVIIQRMEGRYAHLKTYMDGGEGSVRDTIFHFRTAYRAPGCLYFEYEDGGQLNFFTSEGKQNHSGADLRSAMAWQAKVFFLGKVTSEPLGMAIAGFTGVSSTVSYNVPTMLFPVSLGVKFSSTRAAHLRGVATIDRIPCYVVDLQNPKETIWIGKSDYGLRKVQLYFGNGVQSLHYMPVFNAKVPDRLFVFKPPH